MDDEGELVAAEPRAKRLRHRVDQRGQLVRPIPQAMPLLIEVLLGRDHGADLLVLVGQKVQELVVAQESPERLDRARAAEEPARLAARRRRVGDAAPTNTHRVGVRSTSYDCGACRLVIDFNYYLLSVNYRGYRYGTRRKKLLL